MKRASYREGVSWIALNDEPSDVDPDSVASCACSASTVLSGTRCCKAIGL